MVFEMSSDMVSPTNSPAAAARGGEEGLTTGDLEAAICGWVTEEAVEASEGLRLSSFSTFMPDSPRPHLVHFANLNIHFPPISQSAAPPGFGNTPGPLANFPSACWQKLHLPYFQWCTPSGALEQLPLADSMALLGANLKVLTSPESRRPSPLASAPKISRLASWMEPRVRKTAWHFRQWALGANFGKFWQVS